MARFSSRVVRSARSTCRTSLLRDQGDHARAGLAQVRQVGGRVPRPAGGSSRTPSSCAVRRASSVRARAEELGVLGVGARPAALDEAHAEVVQVPGDGQLVVDRQHHALALRAVAQGRVVDVEGVGGAGAGGGGESGHGVLVWQRNGGRPGVRGATGTAARWGRPGPAVCQPRTGERISRRRAREPPAPPGRRPGAASRRAAAPGRAGSPGRRGPPAPAASAPR